MDPKEFEIYNKRCEIIKNLLLKEYKNIRFKFVRNVGTLEMVVVINDIYTITLLSNNTWNEIKRNIDQKISENKDEICYICSEKMIKPVSCNKCSKSYCCMCYINLFKNNRGIITCPNCRYSIGKETPDYMMETCINEIRRKLNI